MSFLTPELLGQLIDEHAPALELFAAQWSLEAIEAVPIPIDPVSGKPFAYRLNPDGTTDLRTPAVHPNNRVYGRHFVIQVRK
jgi:hypothetical protein